MGDSGSNAACDLSYLIVRADKGGPLDLFRFLVFGYNGKFLEGSGEILSAAGDHRWVIFVSIVARKIISFFAKPMEWTGIVVEFILNLLSQNGGLLGLFLNALTGKILVPHRGSDTFISAIGHLDSRVNLYKWPGDPLQKGSSATMDLCVMASKLAYENANVVKNIVDNQWKMHFVEFYDCWNDYQKDRSTQVFILCDKPKDASLVLISFRGTEPFDAADWSTDFDYSWYEIPELGKVHMGFLEALGIGNGAQEMENLDEVTAYFAVRSKLEALLEEHEKAKFIVTGHSLGGALAILFPAVLLLHGEDEMMKRLWGVYTFGQPRVGDMQLQRFMEAHVCRPVPKYFRMVYCNDLVPRLPYDNNAFLYKHFGSCLYYNSFYTVQNVDEEPNRNYFGLRYLIPEHLTAVWELVRSLTMGYTYGIEYKEGWFSILLRLLGLAVPGISEHSPTNYINCIRLGGEH